MSGGGGSQSTSQTLSPALEAILRRSGAGMGRELDRLLPQTGRLARFAPQRIPQMTGAERQFLGRMQRDVNRQGLTPDQVLAQQIYSQQARLPEGLTSGQARAQQFYGQQLGPLGDSPLIAAWRRTELPEILQNTALQGLGAGGMAETIAAAADREAMEVARMQNEAAGAMGQIGAQGFAQRGQAAGGLGQLGQQGLSNLEQILQASSLPRELRAQQQAARTNEIQRLQGWLERTVNFPFGALAQTGVKTTTSGGGGK